MHINQFNSTTYLYSCTKQQIIRSFDTDEQLLDYMATHYNMFFGEHNQVNLTGNDMRVFFDYNEYCEQRCLREYCLLDCDNRVLNPADYRQKVDDMIASLPYEKYEQFQKFGHMGWMSWYHRKPKATKVAHDDLQHGDVLYNCDTNYRFRCDPVPGIGRNRWHFRCWYRFPSTTPELRDMANPENEPFIRKRRKQIPTAYDDIPKCCQRSWKEQSKKRHQWM